MNAEVIPYNSFKDRVKIVREELSKDRYIEIWDKHIYSAEKYKSKRKRKKKKRKKIN